MISETHAAFMAQAIDLAKQGRFTTRPNPNVGCLIVKDGQVVGKGWHQRAGEPHAEVYALQQAGLAAHGATAYVTLEPCSHHGRTPPCSDALIKAGVSRVVVGMKDPNPLVAGQGIQRLEQAGIEVIHSVLNEQSEALNRGFLKRMRKGLPYVRCKLAMSLDGRTAMQSGESKWITGPEARRSVQVLRAESGAVLTGVGTVLADNPQLNVRCEESNLSLPSDFKQPLRVVLDSDLKTPATALICQSPSNTCFFHTCEAHSQHELIKTGVSLVKVGNDSVGKMDLRSVLTHLAQMEVNDVLLESGPTLAGSLLSAGLVDELLVFIAPKLLGSSARPLVELPLSKMSQALDMQELESMPVGADRFIRFRIEAR